LGGPLRLRWASRCPCWLDNRERGGGKEDVAKTKKATSKKLGLKGTGVTSFQKKKNREDT